MAIGGEGYALLAAFARVLPVCVLLVAVTRGVLGPTVALSLALALSAAMANASLPFPASLEEPGALLTLAVSLARELCFGSLVGLALLLPLWAATWALRYSELVVVPLGTRHGPLATLQGLSAVFLCLHLGLHRTLVIGLNQSMLLAPSAGSSMKTAEFGLGVLLLVGEAMALSVALGLPLLLSVLLIEITFGLVRRTLGRSAEPVLGPDLLFPLFCLLALGLIMPAVVEVPAALRTGLRLLRELTQRVAS